MLHILASLVLFTAIAYAQDADRVLFFSHTDSPQDMQEVGTAIRGISSVRQLQVDVSRKAIAAHGTEEQMLLTDWMFRALDVPSGQPPVAPYRISGTDDVVRILYLPHATSIQDFQEAATVTRTIAEIRQVFVYNAQKALIIRGTALQLGMAEWMVSRFEHPENDNDYEVPGGNDDLVRILYVRNAPDVQSFQSLATVVRSVAEIRRAFTHNPQKAIFIRSTHAQAALADWFVKELDRPGAAVQGAVKHEYRVSPAADDLVRVFYVAGSSELPKPDALVKSGAGRLAFPYSPKHAVAVRGTQSELVKAEELVAAQK